MKDSSCECDIILQESSNSDVIAFFQLLFLSHEEKNSRDIDVRETVFFGLSNGSGPGNGSGSIEEGDNIRLLDGFVGG